MDVSDAKGPGDQNLIQTVASLTGLPMELIQGEILPIIEKNGFDPSQLTLEELRKVMLSYLETFQADLLTVDDKGLLLCAGSSDDQPMLEKFSGEKLRGQEPEKSEQS